MTKRTQEFTVFSQVLFTYRFVRAIPLDSARWPRGWLRLFRGIPFGRIGGVLQSSGLCGTNRHPGPERSLRSRRRPEGRGGRTAVKPAPSRRLKRTIAWLVAGLVLASA